MEFVVIIAAILVLGGLLAGDSWLQRQHVARVEADWARADRTIRVPPVGLICHGDRPQGDRPHRVYGALGVVENELAFVGHRSPIYDFAAPLESVRWIGLRTQVRHSGHRVLTSRELLIHVDHADGWRAYVFTDGRVEHVAPLIAEAAGLELHDIGTAYEDFGPAPATYLVLDHAGGWRQVSAAAPDPDTLPADWDAAHNALYLAPECLLYEWANSIPLAAIRSVEALTGEASPFDEDLLRITYNADGDPRTVGFLVREADAWAEVIAEGITPA